MNSNAKRARQKRETDAIANPLQIGEHIKRRWAVGMTVGKRQVATWDRSSWTIQRAGWREQRIFAEPYVMGEDSVHYSRPDTIAEPLFRGLGPYGKYGPHQNYMQCLADILRSYPKAEMVLYAQDDAYFPPGARQFVESLVLPYDCHLLSLWCPSGHGYNVPEVGIARVPGPNIVGAVAYVMPRATAEFLVSCRKMLNWQGSPSRQFGSGRRALDMATGYALRDSGRNAYFLTRSIVDHFEPVANNSTCNNGAIEGFRKSYRYVGNDATFEDMKKVFE